MNPSSRSLAALLFLAVPLVFAVGACSQQEPAAPEAPAAAHVSGSATPGHEPAYTDPDASRLPACKNGAPACEAWERMWPQ
jgi:hypothetical protein